MTSSLALDQHCPRPSSTSTSDPCLHCPIYTRQSWRRSLLFEPPILALIVDNRGSTPTANESIYGMLCENRLPYLSFAFLLRAPKALTTHLSNGHPSTLYSSVPTSTNTSYWHAPARASVLTQSLTIHLSLGLVCAHERIFA